MNKKNPNPVVLVSQQVAQVVYDLFPLARLAGPELTAAYADKIRTALQARGLVVVFRDDLDAIPGVVDKLLSKTHTSDPERTLVRRTLESAVRRWGAMP